jgi:hypothetical protein
MDAPDGLFLPMDNRDAIGELADGHPVDPRQVPLVRAAVAGMCRTSDRGEQQFVVDVSGCGLFNVDTEELIWPRGPRDDIGDDVPLRILTDRVLWGEARRRWDKKHPREWAAFVWQVAVPLSNRLGFVGAWR